MAVLKRLKDSGYEAYLVGGCVRDLLRGIPPHDYDVTTSALPEEILAAFSGVPVVETGLKHGTVTVLWEGLPVEVTTYRVDGNYTDGRHPDGVTFTRSLTEDLARRDFTFNAMAWAPETGIQDPFGGREDLQRKILRCVGDPDRRFTEDGLRILRALRFASTLEASGDPATDQALRRQKERLSAVSRERIREELRKLLCGPGVFEILTAYPEVLGTVLPELLPAVGFDQRNYHHCYDLYSHLARTVASVPPDPDLRLAALLHDVAKPELFSLDEAGVGHFYGHASRSAEKAGEILRNLRCSNEECQRIVALIRHHDGPIEPTPAAVKRKLNKLGERGFFDLIALMRGDNLALAPEFHGRQETYDRLEALAREILSEEQCFSLKDLAVKGGDLAALGLRGKEIGEGLQMLLSAVMEEKTKNDKESLLKYWKYHCSHEPYSDFSRSKRRTVMNLIIVAGMPATGKTTLSKKLAKNLRVPMLEKDEIKEEMYKIQGYRNLEDRAVADIVANAILLRCARNILESGTSLLIVNNFDPSMAGQVQDLIDTTGCKCVTVFLDGDPDILHARYVQRDANHQRHPVNELWDSYPPKPGDVPKEMSRELFREVFEEMGMADFRINAPRIDLDATDPSTIDADALTARIRALLQD